MYIPKFNRIEDVGVMLELMRHHSFATLVSLHGGAPFATHVPFVVESEKQLSSHVARANPQWASFGEQEVLVIFQGDHSFVSPIWYERHPNVPTWNYMTVHAYGKVKIVQEPQRVKALLHRLVLQYEHEWKMEDQGDKYLHGMMQGIVAFEIEVTRLEGKFKLSQNRSQTDQRNVAEALGQSENPSDRAVAAAMEQNLLRAEG